MIDRVGIKKPDKARPIRLVMASIEKKSEFMLSLGRLKYGANKFKKISITDDFSQEERKEIQKWSRKQKKEIPMNEAMSGK